MKIELTNQEAEQFFYNALCNYLPGFCGSYGYSIVYSKEDYEKAKQTATIFDADRLAFADANGLGLTVCYEDVLMEMLRLGFKVTFEDLENDGEYTRTIGIEEIHARVCKAPADSIMDMANETDDAFTADTILQAVLFDGEQIFA